MDFASPDGRPMTRLRRIGLWGASGSGKTSFLAALSVAVNQSRSNWRIVGVDTESVDFITRMTKTLTTLGTFPPGTMGIQELSWTMIGETERIVGGRFRKRTETVPTRFQLDVIDMKGGLFKGEEDDGTSGEDDLDLGFEDERRQGRGGGTGGGTGGGASGGISEELIEKLSVCDGLVYLFDPVREHQEGDEFEHFQWALQRIAHRSVHDGTFAGTHLPHYLAVCITKLDDPKVFHTAQKRGYLTIDPSDPYAFPRVRQDCTEDLFVDLGRVSPTRSALMVHDSIGKYFHPDRVRYFASSSVGFYLPRQATRFRAAQFQNVVPDAKEGYVIRGDIHPINVLEPLLWLGQMVNH